jgi:hypothetical protein
LWLFFALGAHSVVELLWHNNSPPVVELLWHNNSTTVATPGL